MFWKLSLFVLLGSFGVSIISNHDYHSNAKGVVTTSPEEGIIVVRYELDSYPGRWLEQKFPTVLSFWGTCDTLEQCHKFIIEKTPVYLWVDGEEVFNLELVPSFNSDLTFLVYHLTR